MIIFFGAAGAGKSLQGQMLAARHGWRWLSSGQIFRDQADAKLLDFLKTGELIPDELTNQTIFAAIDKAHTDGEVGGVILDGYPRTIPQAEALTRHETEKCGRPNIDICFVLNVPKSELLKRLSKRGRLEDEPAAIDRRLQIHRGEIYPLLNYYNELNVPIAHIDGVGTVGEVHDRIEAELEAYKIVEPAA
ncbi:MAG: nucleoside monophosphate kinase [Candidatus Nomurabacteria bacterium]|jgi:adenylate kinase|nr:nucleoside monophosphate kinase [Candidatus Nomurabacteria bacterium]